MYNICFDNYIDWKSKITHVICKNLYTYCNELTHGNRMIFCDLNLKLWTNTIYLLINKDIIPLNCKLSLILIIMEVISVMILNPPSRFDKKFINHINRFWQFLLPDWWESRLKFTEYFYLSAKKLYKKWKKKFC